MYRMIFVKEAHSLCPASLDLLPGTYAKGQPCPLLAAGQCSGQCQSEAGVQAQNKRIGEQAAWLPVADWGEAQTEMVLNLDAGKVDVAVQTEGGQNAVRVIDVAGTPAADNVAKQNGNIGLWPFKLLNQVGLVVEGSPAARAASCATCSGVPASTVRVLAAVSISSKPFRRASDKATSPSLGVAPATRPVSPPWGVTGWRCR